MAAEDSDLWTLDSESKPDDVTEDCCQFEKMLAAKAGSCLIPKRYVIVALLFCGMLIVHAQRVNIGMTVVAILEKKVHSTAADTREWANLSREAAVDIDDNLNEVSV